MLKRDREVVLLMHREYMRGESMRSIAARHGISRQRIAQLFDAYGFQHPPQRGRPRKITSRDVSFAKRLWRHGGISYIEIARMLNCSAVQRDYPEAFKEGK